MLKKSFKDQIFSDIYKKILEKELKLGDQLPPENRLASIYGVSRTTVREALGLLEQEGHIARYPGKGTFVTSPKPAGAWNKLSGFGYAYRSDWDRIGSRTLSVELVDPSEKCRAALQLAPKEQVIQIIRLRLLADEPVAYMKHHLPGSVFAKDKFLGQNDFFSLRDVINDEFKIFLGKAREEIVAISADEEIGEYLRIEQGAPLLRVSRRSFDLKNRCLEFSNYYVRSDLWAYQVWLSI